MNKAKASAIDKKMDIFACAKGSVAPKSGSEEEKKGGGNAGSTRSRSSSSPDKEAVFVKDFKSEIIAELAKLMNIYRASNDRGKTMGYQRAISNIKACKKPITSVDQLAGIPFVGEGIR